MQRPTLLSAYAAIWSYRACAVSFNRQDGPTAGPFAVWMLFDADGKLLARMPTGVTRNNAGRSYAFRDYYLGARKLALRGERAAYIARVHRSEGDPDYEIAISSPVYNGNRRWVGVLVAALPTGSALGKIAFPSADNSGLTVTLLSPRDRDREGAPWRKRIGPRPARPEEPAKTDDDPAPKRKRGGYRPWAELRIGQANAFRKVKILGAVPDSCSQTV